MKYMLFFLEEIGSEFFFFGRGGVWLIGFEFELWDVVLLVKYFFVIEFLLFV